MINRTLIRLKVVQLLYAFYQNGDRFAESAQRQLSESLEKAHDLYNLLLLIIVDITRIADEIINNQEDRNRITHNDTVISHRFLNNRFAAQLADNEELMSVVESRHLNWTNHRELMMRLYAEITEADYYAEYMSKEEVSYDDDRELWRKAYKNVIMKSTEIDLAIEDMDIYWNDDKEIIDTFVLKTIKRFEEGKGKKQELLPAYRDEEDHVFAHTLLRKAIENGQYYQSLIAKSTHNWEFSRLAYTDAIIMQIALAEILCFPEIPISVTINEYVEIAKCYSTPKSHLYINGILDSISKRLVEERKLFKK